MREKKVGAIAIKSFALLVVLAAAYLGTGSLCYGKPGDGPTSCFSIRTPTPQFG